MDRMDEVEVAQTQIADVPSTFDGSVVLLDVREDDEWLRGHAPGAQHIPMGQVPSRLEEIDADAQLFVVWQAGGRSQRVAQSASPRSRCSAPPPSCTWRSTSCSSSTGRCC